VLSVARKIEKREQVWLTSYSMTTTPNRNLSHY